MSFFYVCEQCGEKCVSEWTDEEAQTEAIATFGEWVLAESAIVCDPCYQEILARTT